MNKLYKEPGELDKVAGLNRTSIFRIGGLLLVLVGGFALAAWILFNFTNPGSNAANSVSTYSARQPESLQVLEWQWENLGGDRVITGRVKNNSRKQYSYVQIEFNLYDWDDNHLDAAMANTNHLEPNSTWKFTVVPIVAAPGQIKSAKLKGVTGF